jgi:hypothetical protein
MTRLHPGSARGLTVLEVVLMVTISVVMIGALAPAVAATIRDARTARATADMTTLATQLQTALTDMGFVEYKQTGTGPGAKTQLLVSDGDVAACATAGAPCVLGGADSWNRLVNLGTVDFIENHLVRNTPRNSAANDYPIPNWKGPYLNAPVDPDPWGNRYMVNADEFNVAANNVHVLSAGPDETVSSAWAGAPLVPGGDDLVALVQP